MEGVQAQTRVLMRTLARLEIPTVIFVNKIDRVGADDKRVVRDIADKLTPAIIAMGSTRDLGTRSADFTPYSAADAAFSIRLADVLADRDDALLAAYVDDETTVAYSRLRAALAEQTGRALVHPVFFGSAITAAGVDSLMTGIKELLPTTEGDVDGPMSGTVFKVERGPAGEKVAYVRMFAGTLRTRDRLQFSRDSGQAAAPPTGRKVTAMSVFERGLAAPRASIGAGQIGKLWGLGDVQIGDAFGQPRTTADHHHFAPPTLEAVVVPRRRADKGALHVALAQLAEQDPLINLRQDDVRQEMFVSLYGEVQKEVIQATLANDYNLDVDFRDTTPICIERPIGTGTAVEILGRASNPFCATVGLRIERAPLGRGVDFRLEAELATIPIFVYKAVDEFRQAIDDVVQETLRQGLYGWQVTDCTVFLTDSGYISPTSTAADFRKLTPLVLMSALKQAGTVVCEPIHHFRLEGAPSDTLGAIMSIVARLRAVPLSQEMRGAAYVLEGEIPTARLHELQHQVPGLTRGEGVLECAFNRYEPVPGTMPARTRTDHNPLNRKEYLIHVMRRL